jgi:MarR family 2-MHQ and catechol resistance regulon transcriptional repressor
MGTRHQGSEDEVRALNAFIKLMRATDSVGARLSGVLAEARLTEGQFGVLETLYHLGPLHPCELAAKLLRSGGNLTLVIDNLERNGLVRRERSTQDRRYVTIHLTPQGRALIAELFPRHAAAIAREMGVLSAAEQEELGRLCRKLGRQLRD